MPHQHRLGSRYRCHRASRLSSLGRIYPRNGPGRKRGHRRRCAMSRAPPRPRHRSVQGARTRGPGGAGSSSGHPTGLGQRGGRPILSSRPQQEPADRGRTADLLLSVRGCGRYRCVAGQDAVWGPVSGVVQRELDVVAVVVLGGPNCERAARGRAGCSRPSRGIKRDPTTHWHTCTGPPGPPG